MIEGTVKYEGSGDVYVAAYIDGVQTNGDFPDKLVYKFDHAECNNNAEINFDTVKWKATVNNVGTAKTKCNVYFITRDQVDLISNKIKYFAESDAVNLAYDDTSDKNLRYIGANPNNYVWFNDELWRTIGVFKDIDDGTGKKEWRTKITRNQSIGDKAWDASSNDWNTADIKDELNGSYLDGLIPKAKNMVTQAIWSIGKSSTTDQPNLKIYMEERDGSNWQGEITLMYVSDYAFAVGGTNRGACLNINPYDWSSHSECFNNCWLFNRKTQWTLTSNSSTTSSGFPIDSTGYVLNYNGVNAYANIRPTLYLGPNVEISGGSGTSTDPYTLTI